MTMSKVYLLAPYKLIGGTFRNVSYKTLQKAQFSSKPISSSSSSSSSGSSSDDDIKLKEKIDEKKKSKEALDKLNKLLLTMTGEEVPSKSKLNFARPLNKRQENKEKKRAKPESPEIQIEKAAKVVAESIGGDVKQTQSELLMKLLNVSNDKETTNGSLKDLVKGMKIDQERPESAELSKAQQVRQILQGRGHQDKFNGERPRFRATPRTRQTVVEKIDLFGSEPLGIFNEKETDLTEGVKNKVWDHLYQNDLKLAVTHPPSNYFQQMILWTEQRKVWKFPIDNEQGLEEEKQVSFTEHVFLEKHLEPWCPTKGPLRHFMELVCVGLSKNPYLTVEAKKEHILWYKKYFDDKKQLLKETGALPDQEPTNQQSQKQIE